MEDLTQSPKRELSAYSPAEEKKEYEGNKGEGEEEEGEGEEEGDGDEGGDYNESDGAVGQVNGGGHRHFILSLIWTVNDFYSTMSLKVFNTLCNRYQISEHIPLQLLRKFERCYSSRTMDIGMYNAMFTVGLRLSLTDLHCQLANYLGLFVSQLAPNAWRTFIRAKVIWGQLSGGSRCLTFDEFFYCYKPQQISISKGIYYFLARKSSFRLVSNMPDSNRNWKNR